MIVVNVGILATGGIAEIMAYTLNEMQDCCALAVGSRTLESAVRFAKKYNIQRAYGSYEELCADSEIDLIYIATPPRFHYENMLTALEAGRNVICEKPFTINVEQARHVLEISKRKKLFCAEAIWTRYLPLREKFNLIDSIGKPLSLTANTAHDVSYIKIVHDLELGGGALLALGVYPINFALMAFGNEIKEIKSKCTYFNTGVDQSNEITFIYNNGLTANLTSSIFKSGDLFGTIYGTKGELIFKNCNGYDWVELRNTSGIARFVRPERITGFEYQVRACVEAIKGELIEPKEMPHSEIIRVMEIMDELRAQWGFRYPFE